MNDFLELVNHRQSDRGYLDKPVEPEKIAKIIEAARLAPSACNSQPWHMIVVDEPTKCAELADALQSVGMNKFTSQAPCHIVVVMEQPNFSARLGGWIKNKHFPLIDCGILAAHITLAATDLGLGSCMLGWFDEPKVRRILGIPRSRRVLLDITIGYSAQQQREKTRKPVDEISSHNKY
ncbi:MAG: nitroreductase family protein [Candidatus Limisoma sp.]|nr:nitroreductase family protein [Candidatus Limisoma sp.]